MDHQAGDERPFPSKPIEPGSPPALAYAPAAFANSPASKGHPLVAWVVIALTCAILIASRTIDFTGKTAPVAQAAPEDRLGVMLMELQSKYMAGAANLTSKTKDANAPGTEALLYEAAEDALDGGSIGQRQRFVILAAELMGPEEAHEKLTELSNQLMSDDDDPQDQRIKLTADQAEVQKILVQLYAPAAHVQYGEDGDISTVDVDEPTIDQPAVENLSQAERELLVRELGWFGELALVPPETEDTVARKAVLSPAISTVYFFVGVLTVGAFAGLLGFAGLVTLVVLTIRGKVRSRMSASVVHHGIYAETFAFWMVLFLTLNVFAGWLGSLIPSLAMLIVFVSFFISLLALLWPVIRGVSWSQVRHDIGWTLGRSPALEPLIGVGSYLMALPVLVVGAAFSYLLLLLQKALQPPGPLFQPSGGPAHPIIEQLGGPDWLPKIAVILLGAVAAPIVEETMFRGVLYRHLRDASRWWRVTLSIIFGTLINSFVFAAIHPQGLVGIPVLMSLAITFTLIREWRGTLIPSMIMHGMSNFFVMTLLMIALSL